MSTPWLKFYPSDWRADPALRMCSVAARGLWMEMLCIMHEAEPRGTLRINGKPITQRQMAVLAGCTVDEAMKALTELEDAGVFSREADGTIYSRRIMRDEVKAKQDKANGKKGGNPSLAKGVNPPDNPPDKGQVKAQKPEARDQISDASASDVADAPSSETDYRQELFRSGREAVERICGMTPSAARSQLGKWLKTANDDARLVLSKVAQAETERILNPIAWITASIGGSSPSASAKGFAGALQQISEMRSKHVDANGSGNRGDAERLSGRNGYGQEGHDPQLLEGPGWGGYHGSA